MSLISFKSNVCGCLVTLDRPRLITNVKIIFVGQIKN